MQTETVHPQELPLLLLPNSFLNNNDIKSFLSIPTYKLHHLNLPAAQGKIICGSSAGWLIVIDYVSTIILINPLTSAHIQLPQISPNKVLIHKAILSSEPECDPYNFVVMVIYGEKKQLAYYKARSESWEVLEAGCYYDDVISEGRRKFYAVNEHGKVVKCKVNSLPAFKEVLEPWSFQGNKLYLFRIEGQFFVVFRSLKDHQVSGYETYKFSVFKLNVKKERYHMMGSFPSVALFLGQNQSTWLHADETKGVVGNSIYFTDDYASGCGGGGGHDFGRYNMEDDSVERFECWDFQNLKCIESRPIYLISNM